MIVLPECFGKPKYIEDFSFVNIMQCLDCDMAEECRIRYELEHSKHIIYGEGSVQ